LSIFGTPGVMVELIGNHRLPALVYVNVPHSLFARLYCPHNTVSALL
jgi:hypothetical protein